HGPRLGGDRRRRRARVPEPGGPRKHRQLDRDQRRSAVLVGDLRRDPRDHDAGAARRPAAERARAGGARGRRPRSAPLRRVGMSENGAAKDDLLVATGIRKVFGGLIASNDIDFTVPRGSIVSLIGPNGAGKTTFFNMLTGVYKPTAGRIVFDGAEVTGKPPHAITARGVGRTFQNIRLFQNMSSIENVLVGMHSRLKGGILRAVIKPPSLKREEIAAA